MTCKAIYLPVMEEQDARATLAAAATIARSYKAHISATHLVETPLPATAYAYPVAVDYVQESVRELDRIAVRRAEELEGVFTTLCGEAGLPIIDPVEHKDVMGATASWTTVAQAVPFGYVPGARLSDLVVLARPRLDGPLRQMASIEELLFQSGRPILLVSTEHGLPRCPETVLVAWNGGREAAAALASAMPFLEQAQNVIVASVGGVVRDARSAAAVAAYLGLHGVHASHVDLPAPKSGRAAETLLTHANDSGADLIAMGAYSHHRWREIVLGGVTRFMIEEADLPVLMTH